MNDKILSIIIPAYNVEGYIEKCLDSIKDLSNVEAIVVNDGSTDATQSKIAKYTQRYSHIFNIDIENTGTPAIPRNIGIEKARGKYILFIDGDDYIDSEKLKEAIKKIEEHDCELLVSNIINFNNSSKWINTKFNETIFASEQICNLEKNKALLSNLGPCNKIYNREWLINNNLKFIENIRNGEDQPFTLGAYLKATQIYIMQDPFYYYRQREDSADKSATQIKGIIPLRELLFIQKINIELLKTSKIKITVKDLLSSRIRYDFIRHIDFIFKNGLEKELIKLDDILSFISYREILGLENVGYKDKIKIVLIKKKAIKILRFFYKRKEIIK